MTPSQLEARSRVRAAAARLQAAHEIIRKAGSEIDQVIPLDGEWLKILALYNQARDLQSLLECALEKESCDLNFEAKAQFDGDPEDAA